MKVGKVRPTFLLLFSLFPWGCTPLYSAKDLPQQLPQQSQIKSFPFLAQERYQCAPAAAAMLLTHLGASTNPDEIAAQIYTPGKKGSFQSDLVNAFRRQGKIPYQLDADMSSLLSSLANGYPVLVLLNLGFSWIPFYHYGVVVGYDLKARNIEFTSGRKQSETISLNAFLRMWQRVGNWGIVVLNPGDIPETARLSEYMRAVAALEQAGFDDAAEASYRATLSKWGESIPAYVGLGNITLKRGDYVQAANWFEKALVLEPASALILNNYAWALAHAGQEKKALAQARLAVEHDKGECASTCRETLDYIISIEAP